LLAAAGLTVTLVLPVVVLLMVSVAVSVWLPAFLNVTPLVKVCVPLSVAPKV
jgi:hypothetical protein